MCTSKTIIKSERKSFTFWILVQDQLHFTVFKDVPCWIFIFTFWTVSSLEILWIGHYFSPARDRTDELKQWNCLHKLSKVHRVCSVHIIYLFKLNFQQRFRQCGFTLLKKINNASGDNPGTIITFLYGEISHFGNGVNMLQLKMISIRSVKFDFWEKFTNQLLTTWV